MPSQQFARDTFLGPLCRGDCANDKELQALLPSQLQKGYRGVADDMVLPKHHDTASLEMLTMLCARLASDLDLWERFARFMVFAERSPQRLLMEHEAACVLPPPTPCDEVSHLHDVLAILSSSNLGFPRLIGC